MALMALMNTDGPEIINAHSAKGSVFISMISGLCISSVRQETGSKLPAEMDRSSIVGVGFNRNILDTHFALTPRLWPTAQQTTTTPARDSNLVDHEVNYRALLFRHPASNRDFNR
jgi:hypothetical protein